MPLHISLGPSVQRDEDNEVTKMISPQSPHQSPQNSRTFSRTAQLTLGTVLGLMTLAATAQTASANPLQLLPIVGDLLGSTPKPPPLPSELDIIHDNVQGNNVNLCVLTCNSPTPGARPPAPQSRTQAPQRAPQGAPQRVPQGAAPQGQPRPQSQPRSSGGPSILVDPSAFRIPL